MPVSLYAFVPQLGCTVRFHSGLIYNAGNMARYAFVALCLLFAQTWQRWRTIWARCGTGWAPLMFNLSPR